MEKPTTCVSSMMIPYEDQDMIDHYAEYICNHLVTPGIGVTLPNDYDEPSLDYPSTCIYRLPCGICRLLNSQCLKGAEKIEITC